MLSALIFYTLLFIGLVIVPAVFILIFLLFLDHERQLWHRGTSAIGPIVKILATMPVVARFGNRFPRTTVFLSRRFNVKDPWGLPATVAAIGVFFGLWFFLGVLEDIVAKDPLVTLDIRLHNLIPIFRSPGMTWFMLVLTQFGSTIVLSLVCLGTALLALARKRQRVAATLVLALSASGLLSVILKALIGHERPMDAIIHANEASFPSGHLLSSAVMYGLLATLLLSSRAGRKLRATGITLLLLLIVGIGLSRLYLGVHWPSDLLGSLAVALMLLPPLLFFLYHNGQIQWVDGFHLPVNARAVRVAGICILIAAIGMPIVLARSTKMVAIAPPPTRRVLDILTLQTTLPLDLPRQSEDIIGGRMEPVSLVLIGSEKDIVDGFTRAGWRRADLPTPVRIVQESLAALQNRSDPSGPATPVFLADQPQVLTFEKPDTEVPSIRHRHHTRLWVTTYCIGPDCRPVWLATASYDVGVELSKKRHLPTHRIDPMIDNERDLIVTDLIKIGATKKGMINILPPLTGTNAAGDSFSTNGRAAILVLP